MIKAHKIRLNPTSEQTAYLIRGAGIRRFCYNWGLAEWNRQVAAGEKPSALHLKEQFNAIRKEQFPLANDRFTLGAHWVEPQVLGEFVAQQRQIKATNQQKHRLGRINLAERLRFAGKIVGATVSTTAGHWYISIQVEVPHTPEVNTGPILGVDVGIKALAIVSDGRRFENQRPLTTQMRKLQRLQRHASRKQPGSKNRAKANLKVARLHEEIACIRADAHHKLTTAIARTSSVVGLEDLHVKGMLKNRKLARAMADAGLGQLRTFFVQKMRGVDGQAIFVDRFYPSTKTCSGCGHVKKRMPLKYRTYICMACGVTIDRDLNAALNLEREARRILTQLAT